MKVTLKDIAQKAGVSVNTVSLALRDMPSVKQETREKILEIADTLGYAAQKSRVEMHNIGLVSTGERLRDSYFYMSFHQHILTTAHAYDFDMMVFSGASCDTDQEELRRKFESRSIAGIVILGDMEERIAAKVAGCGIPVVATGARYNALKVCTIIEDNLGGARLAVRHLQERGYRKIGFLGNPCHSTGFMERYQGYVGAMAYYNLPIDPAHMVLGLDQIHVYDYDRMLSALERRASTPEAFLCANDNLAMIATKALAAKGLSVPRDVALIGFDNTAIGKMALPSITSIDVHCAEQAAACVRKLISFIESGETSAERIALPVSLAEGESVGWITAT